MRGLAIGAVLALALAAAGCGGGGGGKTLSKQEYASQLNQICKDADTQRKAAGSISSPADVVSKGPKLLAVFDAMVSKVEKLKPPAELKADADKLISEAKQLRGVIAEVIDAAKKNDLTKITGLGAKGDALTKDLDALGTKLGAPNCAKG
jgi:hypothetical protein